MIKTRTISNSDNIIDSRDIIARIDELTADRQALVDAIDVAKELVDDETNDRVEAAKDAYQEWIDGDDSEELTKLEALRDEAESSTSDWQYGATLINDDYFVEYAKDLADDLGAIKSSDWPLNCIDWEMAAEALQQDYTSVDFDGQEFWVR